MNELQGSLDRVDGGWLYGWAWNGEGSVPVDVTVEVDALMIGTFPADVYRSDLERAGIGNGNHGFMIQLPESCLDAESHSVAVIRCADGTHLPGSPFVGRVAPLAPDPAPHYRSPFGGLWVDLSNASEIVDGKEELGFITALEAERLRSFIKDGFIQIAGAVDPEFIDELNRDILDVWSNPLSAEMYAESYEHGVVEVGPIRPEHEKVSAKLLDLYAHLESARRVVFAPAVVRFLELIFERPALAFQCLYFQKGTEQPVHQDPSYVRVSSALEMAASWIALEDIQPASGELEYYVGSHCLKEYLFENDKKWMPQNSPEHAAYLESLHNKSSELGLSRQKFLPKKGDVLIWAANLAHGGSRVENDVSRRSIVTHYCPLSCRPVYDDSEIRTPAIQRYGEHSYYSVNPRRRGRTDLPSRSAVRLRGVN